MMNHLKCAGTNTGMHEWRAGQWDAAEEKLWCCRCARLATEIIDEAVKAHKDDHRDNCAVRKKRKAAAKPKAENDQALAAPGLPAAPCSLPDGFGEGGLPELPFDKLYRELAESRAREARMRVALADTVDRLRAEGHGDDPKDLQGCWQCSLHNRNKAALEYPTAENAEMSGTPREKAT